MKKTRIALVGGGTGGHVTPIVALVQYMRTEDLGVEFFWIGEANSMESKFASDNNIPFGEITSYRIPSMRSIQMIPALFKMIRGFFEARKSLKLFRPDVLFSKGGPGAISVVMAAKTLKIPVYIHDSDTIPGVSNRSMAKFADTVFLGFEEAKSYFPKSRTEVIGQILSPRLLEENNESDAIHFPNNEKTRVLVVCGSQGARAIYTELLKQLPNLSEFEFIIALGTQNSEFDFSTYENVRTFPWIGKDLGTLYREADIVLARGGATNLAEAVAFGATIVSIPLPIAAFDHQRANVSVYEKKGLVIGLEEKNLTNLSKILKEHTGRRSYEKPQFDIQDGVRRISNILTRKQD